MTLEELQAKYQELHPEGKVAPPRFKNDTEWLTKKIESFLGGDEKPQKEVAPISEETLESAKESMKKEKKEKKVPVTKFEKYKQRLYDLDNGIATTCDETGVDIRSSFHAKIIPSECKIVYDFEKMGIERPEKTDKS